MYTFHHEPVPLLFIIVDPTVSTSVFCKILFCGDTLLWFYGVNYVCKQNNYGCVINYCAKVQMLRMFENEGSKVNISPSTQT